MSKPLKVFITYSHKDTKAKDELATRLAVLRSEGMINIWDDNEITPGKKWRDAISSSLADSDLLLYLVSKNSLASENCNKELAKALTEKTRIIPIILEDCDWLHHELSDFQALPDESKPIIKWEDKSEGWQNVVNGIRKVIREMQPYSTGTKKQSKFYKTDSNEFQAELAFQYGNSLLMLRQIDRAIEVYSYAIERNPYAAHVYNNRGEAYRIKNEIDCAIGDYTEAIKLDSELVEAYNNRGVAYRNKGEIDKAILDYNRAIELNPNYAEAFVNRGTAYDSKGDFDQAIANYNKALTLNPDEPVTYNNRGVAYLRKGNVKQAIENYNKAIRLKPDYAGAYYNRGEALLHLSEWEKVKVDLIAAKDMGTDIVAAFRNDYKNVEAFEKRHLIKLPEDIAFLLTQRRRIRFPKKQKAFNTNRMPLESPNVVNLREQLRHAGIPLGEYIKAKPAFGINTGPTEVFVIDKATRNKLIADHPSSAEILKPFSHGKDLRRWHVDTPQQWLVFTYRGIAINDYPAILKYLEEHRDPLSKRKGKQEWYELPASFKDAERFAQPKLVCPNTYNHQTFAVDTAGYYYGKTAYLIPTEEKWLCGLLNSHTVEWFYSQVSKQLTIDYLRVHSGYIQQIPIPDLTPEQKALIGKIVDYLIYLQQQPTINSKDLAHARDRIMLGYFERIIDGLVYETYLREELHASNKHFLQPLLEEQLPPIEDIEGDKMSVCRDIFELLYERTHLVRRNLYYLDSVKPVRIIEGKL